MKLKKIIVALSTVVVIVSYSCKDGRYIGYESGRARDNYIFAELAKPSNKNRNLIDFMSDCILKDRGIIFYPKDKKLQLVTENKNDSKFFLDDLTNFISVIEYLRKNNQIFIHENPRMVLDSIADFDDLRFNTPNLNRIDNFEERISKNEMQFDYTFVNNFYDYLDEYSKNFVYCRFELQEYVRNNFKSEEDLRYESTILWTRIAAIVSFIGLFIAIILPFYTKTKIDDNRIESINEGLKSIKKTLKKTKFR